MPTDYENVAKQVGTTPAAIERRVTLILTENKPAWDATGFDESEQSSRAVRIAARQMITEKRKDCFLRMRRIDRMLCYFTSLQGLGEDGIQENEHHTFFFG